MAEHSQNILALIGLGNPGSKYRNNRHNIGFLVLQELAQKYGAQWSFKDKSEYAQIKYNEKKIILVQPQTFMNTSGQVIPSLQKKGIKPENILVVHDELEKPFGTLAIKCGGSARGHNGLKSIIEFCGAEFWRLRCGIGRPEQKEDVPDYVLSNFSEDQDRVARFIADAIECIEKSL